MPGRTFANGEPIWLCNAGTADSKVFGRSLLAKVSSSICSFYLTLFFFLRLKTLKSIVYPFVRIERFG